MKCHMVDNDGTVSAAVDRTNQLRIYNLSSDKKFWDLAAIENLNMLPFNNDFLPIRPATGHIAWIGRKDNLFSIFILRKDSTRIEEVCVSE